MSLHFLLTISSNESAKTAIKQLTNQPTPWSRVLLEKPTDPQLVTRNLTVHYLVYKCSLLVPTLKHARPVPTLPPYLAHLISISIPSTENILLKVISTLRFPAKSLCALLISPTRVTFSGNPICLNFILSKNTHHA